METRDYVCELSPPPSYTASDGEHLKEEMFQNIPSQQSQTTVVTILPEIPPVHDHVIWSMFNTLYMNFFCLGLLALVFSIKSRDRKLVGDRSGANGYGSTARCLNFAATTLSILSFLLTIIIIIVSI